MTTDGNCKSCGSPLVRYKWNSVADMVVCDNYRCKLFRTPMSNTASIASIASIAPKEKRVTKGKQKLKAPEWLGEPNDPKENKSSDFQVRLDRLRRYIYTEGKEKG